MKYKNIEIPCQTRQARPWKNPVQSDIFSTRQWYKCAFPVSKLMATMGEYFSSLFLFCNNNGIWKFNAWREKLYQKALVMENPCFSICKSRYVLQTHSLETESGVLWFINGKLNIWNRVCCAPLTNLSVEMWSLRKGPSSRIVKCPIYIYRIVNLSLPHVENNCCGNWCACR